MVLDDFKLTHNIRFVQRLFLIEFIKPLFLNDQVDVQTIISKIGSTSFIFTQKIIKNKQIVTKAKTVYVSINNSGSKTLLPDIFHNLRAGNRSRRCNHVRW